MFKIFTLFLKTHTQALLLEIQIWGMCKETILKKLPHDFSVNPYLGATS